VVRAQYKGAGDGFVQTTCGGADGFACLYRQFVQLYFPRLLFGAGQPKAVGPTAGGESLAAVEHLSNSRSND
jgi:hypothetical protein